MFVCARTCVCVWVLGVRVSVFRVYVTTSLFACVCVCVREARPGQAEVVESCCVSICWLAAHMKTTPCSPPKHTQETQNHPSTPLTLPSGCVWVCGGVGGGGGVGRS